MNGHGATGIKRRDRHIDSLAHGVEHDSGLSDGAADGEHDARSNSAKGRRKHDLTHDLPLGSAQTVRAPTNIARYGANGLLGRTHDDGEHKQSQGHSSGEHGETQAHSLNEERVAKQAHDDRGYRSQGIGCVSNDIDQTSLLGVLG